MISYLASNLCNHLLSKFSHQSLTSVF
uniref:Uncharacterized protein n=1 Tax=Arundo donax TaxID=35708 RepID=A0A0A8YF63_ARUDO